MFSLLPMITLFIINFSIKIAQSDAFLDDSPVVNLSTEARLNRESLKEKARPVEAAAPAAEPIAPSH